ncbi:carboxypeptidase-like regulatory domain-containing protein [Engelhardtia mirabilis]|uniref:Carboxypeptidase regulatory-like domain-containing protein n=1 Tax=Engelhardtia mirabilis TaxID=2528011 RepID=A0A518BGF4_9BACT|nr:hypothetical protein Pla133_11280 [Planctomycetes bacterium Pla133]QDV00389.1 hypothetical protein Pla86_11280 [Planctomycetes bacterium Pla86]
MSLPWTLGGAVCGALVALGMWFAERPSSAPASAAAASPTPPRSTIAADHVAPAATPQLDLVHDASTARATVEVEPAADPLAGLIAFGRISDPDCRPIQARLVLEDDDANLKSTDSAADGGWALLGLAPGPHRLSVTAKGFVGLEESIELPARAQWQRDFVLARALSIPVRFEDAEGVALEVAPFSEDPASFLCVVGTDDPPRAVLPGVRSRTASRYGAGTFEGRGDDRAPPDLGERHQGLLRLNAAPPLWASLVYRDVVLETRELVGDESELVFVVDLQTLADQCSEVRVRVVDATTGALLEEVALAHPSGGRSIEAARRGNQMVFTDVPPGTLDLVGGGLVGAGDFEWIERSVQIPPRSLVDLGTIEVRPRIEWTARVVDTSGEPLDLQVEAARPQILAGVGDLDQRVSTRPDADGRSTFNHLGAGRTLLRVGGKDGWARIAREVETSAQSEIELVVPRGTEVVFPFLLAPGETYVVAGEDGLPLLAGSYLRRQTWLVPGRYTLTRRGADGVSTAQPFNVGTDRTVVRWEQR